MALHFASSYPASAYSSPTPTHGAGRSAHGCDSAQYAPRRHRAAARPGAAYTQTLRARRRTSSSNVLIFVVAGVRHGCDAARRLSCMSRARQRVSDRQRGRPSVMPPKPPQTRIERARRFAWQRARAARQDNSVGRMQRAGRIRALRRAAAAAPQRLRTNLSARLLRRRSAVALGRIRRCAGARRRRGRAHRAAHALRSRRRTPSALRRSWQ